MNLIALTDDLPDSKSTKEHLGGKGWSLWWLQHGGYWKVPPALIIPTTASALFRTDPVAALSLVEADLPAIKKYFVDKLGYMPLLAVRSSGVASAPGMMDTILNVGLDPTTAPFWTEKLGPACALESYSSLIAMYGSVVKGLEKDKLAKPTFVATLAAYKRLTKSEFPEADTQLLTSIQAVFESWNNERAVTYRKMQGIPEDQGLAVVIQAMVFGNMNENSGTGVLFTRDPDSGENKVVGEFVAAAQGEVLVSGEKTPQSLAKMAEWNADAASELLKAVSELELARREVQDVEFTVQDGVVYILQTRPATRTPRAAVKIAMDMYAQGMITKEEAISRVSARNLDLADQPILDPKFKISADFTGLGACSGVASGVICLSSEEAVTLAAKGHKVVLVRETTTTNDIKGMQASVAFLTMTGGRTCHAAVVGRAMNRVCIVGLGADITQFQAGQQISLDGTTGRVWTREVPIVGGKSADVTRFRQMVLGDASLLIDRVPEHQAARLTLDLVNRALEGNDLIVKLIEDCQKMCARLTVMVGPPSSEQLSILSVFFTAKELADRLASIRKTVDALPASPKFSVIGWVSKSHPHVEAAKANDLVSLINLKKSALMDTSSGQGIDDKALKRVIGWLAAEGIELKGLNVKDGHVAWTVQVA